MNFAVDRYRTFTPTSKSNPCPTCGKTNGNCRTTEVDLVLCMSLEQAAGFKSLGLTTDSTWTKFVPETGETSPETRAIRRRESEAQRAAAEAQQAAEAMSAVKRDRYYQRLLSQLSLHLADRADLIKKRGFTAEQIKIHGFKSVEQWQRLDFELPNTLPGVTIDGRSLNVAAAGYLCPMRNAAGLIVGMQLRVRGADDNKYRWLTSRTRKRPNGQQPKTAEYRENPLSVFRGGSGVALVEGTGPKPALAAARLGTNIIGAAGGQWCASPETLRDAIAKLGNPDTLTLYLDAGDTGKPQVMRRWHRTIELLQRWGHEVLCWIPQGDRDIDELTDYSSLELAPAAIVLEIGRRTQPAAGFGGGLGRGRRVSREEWLVRQATIDKSIKLPSDETAVQQTLGRMVRNALEARKAPTQAAPAANTDCTAIVPWRAPIDPIGQLVVTEGTVPTYAEWQALDKPRLHIEDEPVPVLLKLVELGYETVLLDDIVGGGKTHTVGEFLQTWQDAQQWRSQSDRERAVYFAADYRNASTSTLEAIPETPTGGALSLDHEHLTPSGQPHRKRAPKGSKTAPDIAALCSEDENVQAARAKGVDLYRGSNSPLCENCHVGTKHCPYLWEMAKMQEESAIRSHLSKGGSGRVAFVDEAGQTIQATRTITAKTADLDGEMAWLSTYKPNLYLGVEAIAKRLKQGLDRAASERGHYGLTHAELMGFMPNRDELELMFWDAVGGMALRRGDDPWEWPTAETVANSLMGSLQPNPDRLFKGQSVTGKAHQIDYEMTPAVLPRLIKLIMGGSGDVALAPNGQLTFSYRDRRHQRTLSNFDTVFLMDATPDAIDLGRRLGIHHQDITRVSWTNPTFENLTIKIVDGIGKATQQRRHEGHYSEQQRINRLVEALASQGLLTGLLDLKTHMGNYSDMAIIRGHQFAHSRGSNEYKQCSQMIIVAGNARENLGAALATWHMLTGETATVANASPAFWAWVERRARANLLQGNGRTRAQHRPDAAITHYIVGEVSETDIAAMQDYFTGCAIERVQAYDICPDAASRGYQSDRAICEAMWAATERGEDGTITQIADATGMTKGAVSKRVSEMLKTGGYSAFRQSFRSLYKALYSERKLSELAPEHQFIAAEYLPQLAQEFSDRIQTADDVAAEVIYTIQALGDDAANVLSACDSATLAALVGAIAAAMPANDRRVLDSLRAIGQNQRQPAPAEVVG